MSLTLVPIQLSRLTSQHWPDIFVATFLGGVGACFPQKVFRFSGSKLHFYRSPGGITLIYCLSIFTNPNCCNT